MKPDDARSNRGLARIEAGEVLALLAKYDALPLPDEFAGDHPQLAATSPDTRGPLIDRWRLDDLTRQAQLAKSTPDWAKSKAEMPAKRK